ncbi:MAG TPA: FAD-binding protein [Humidesulfovibrio sp.]|uniref:FAD-binding protein n=1 Tax=Humidesulfovibrio sp. TaxID=2910988 RepID=UPI002CF2DE5F|nr:FAD-binding protein [Humidesulfovibrio sp.]HWR04386.1 FAD-binding protein [Humidesulfovibrio sp.]
MPPTHARTACHVLVLGAGLAGMRAAWAAKEAAPGLDVLLVSPRKSPSGSSFANRNNALGLQAPLPHEAEGFVDEVLRLAEPGFIDPELVRALAQDAPLRAEELLDGPGGLGLDFRRDAAGRLLRFTGCFSPVPRALVFDGLANAHAAFLKRLREHGVHLLNGFDALEIVVRGGRATGALLAALRGGRSLDVGAGAVIAALGGPAPLFGRRICGPGSGLGYGLLHSAGARLVNAQYLQFFWGRARDRAFVNPGDLPWSEFPWLEPAPELAPLAASRRMHCPMAHGLADAALDRELLARRGADGLVLLPGQQPLALYAHAGNGGARIDAHGRTTVPGLYACGECAGGMHGAQRLGGGMVLAALVFGARAGLAAAQEAGTFASWPSAAPAHPPGFSLPVDANFLRRMRRGMDRHARPFAPAGPARTAFTAWLAHETRQAASQRQRLLALSALLVLGEMS